MPIKRNWGSSKLGDYLLYDYWEPYSGWRVLVGLDYFETKRSVTYPLGVDPFSLDDDIFSPDYDENLQREIQKMEIDLDRLRDFWHRAGLENDDRPPSFFIDWALSKRFEPSWLDWARENDFYLTSQEIPKQIGTVPQESAIPVTPVTLPGWRKAFEYESEGLNALYELIERNFFDADGKPIYDPEGWPIKKSLTRGSINWSSRTLEEADTIITSGKRKGKAAK